MASATLIPRATRPTKSWELRKLDTLSIGTQHKQKQTHPWTPTEVRALEDARGSAGLGLLPYTGGFSVAPVPSRSLSQCKGGRTRWGRLGFFVGVDRHTGRLFAAAMDAGILEWTPMAQPATRQTPNRAATTKDVFRAAARSACLPPTRSLPPSAYTCLVSSHVFSLHTLFGARSLCLCAHPCLCGAACAAAAAAETRTNLIRTQ